MKVLAQGTFDLLHPGHVHYLREAAELGDELYVIIGRSENVTHKEAPVIADEQRRDVVAALDPVDHAVLGHEADIFVPVEEIDPDVIALGHDQHHEVSDIQSTCEARGIDCEVTRVSPRAPLHDDELLSTADIVERVCEQRC